MKYLKTTGGKLDNTTICPFSIFLRDLIIKKKCALMVEMQKNEKLINFKVWMIWIRDGSLETLRNSKRFEFLESLKYFAIFVIRNSRNPYNNNYIKLTFKLITILKNSKYLLKFKYVAKI